MDPRDGRFPSLSPTCGRGPWPAILPLAAGLQVFLMGCGGDQEPGRAESAPVPVHGAGDTLPSTREVARTTESPHPPAFPPKPTPLQRAIDSARSLSDDDLKAVLTGKRELLQASDKEKDADAFTNPDYPFGRTLAILEAVRRGGKSWEGFFAALVSSADSDQDREMLTALRRIQGRPDPLEVTVESAEQVEVTWPDIPRFKVTLRNREADGPRFAIGPENNYRGGFLRAFRFDVVRADGSRVPVRQRWGDFGGVETLTSLKPGEEWHSVLDMRDYISALDCGVYTVRAQYGEDAMFSNARDLRGRICYSSEPFSLSVGLRRITLTRAEDKAVRTACNSLPDSGPVRFVVGTAVEEHEAFIAGDSPEGVLLRSGWKAVPALLDELEIQNASLRRRAWALALLFGISGANDPRPMSVFSGNFEGIDNEDSEISEGGLGGAGVQRTSLGTSRYSGSAWECLIGGPHSTLGGQGGAFVMSQAGGGGEPSPVAQKWLIGRWKAARKFLRIEIQ